MSRQSGEPTICSIALLQERFRQLQRAKEMRQERELLRLFYESERPNATTSYEPSGLVFYSKQIPMPMPPLQGSLYHQSHTQRKRSGAQVTDTPLVGNLWSTNTFMHNTDNNDDSDVDTSLHL
ncbi:hypothetical protein ACOSQ2_030571 [Xanthoceras sorbifolium]